MTRHPKTTATFAVLTLAVTGAALAATANAASAPDAQTTQAAHTVLPALSAPSRAELRQTPPRHPSPSHFTHGRVDNEWFPLRPGNQLVYRGRDESGPYRDVFITTYRTKVIDHVVCREVFDRVFKRGHVRERTTDWYAQTKRGTVWYFGERTAELSARGRVVSREGSWRSGRDGAQAGIFMPVRPRVGQAFHQEDYPGHAEDRFRVLSLRAHVSAPVVASHHALLTKETTPLEPGVVDHKLYVRDIGTVQEATVRGGLETDRLVSMTRLARR